MDEQNPTNTRHAHRYKLAPLYCRPWTLNGLSGRLIESHYEVNYGGAVRRLNALTQELASLDCSASTDAVHRLKRDEFAALNCALLHELYFASLGGDGRAVPDALSAALTRDFGSLDNWRTEFVALAEALGNGTGWVVLTYVPREGRLVNHVASEDVQSVAGGIPVLALDMYEHAYHIDFGANATAYIATFMRNIDWRSVEKRYVSAMKVEPPLRLEQPQFGGLPSVSVEDVQALIDAGKPIQIIDTRPRHYASKSHDMMKAAVWRDPERVHDWIGSLSKDQPVVTFCVYGFHIGCETAAALREAGFDAAYMAGGHTAWKAIKGDSKLFADTDSTDASTREEQPK
jgi:Fe-Mn family superoxide dismutase